MQFSPKAHAIEILLSLTNLITNNKINKIDINNNNNKSQDPILTSHLCNKETKTKGSNQNPPLKLLCLESRKALENLPINSQNICINNICNMNRRTRSVTVETIANTIAEITAKIKLLPQNNVISNDNVLILITDDFIERIYYVFLKFRI